MRLAKSLERIISLGFSWLRKRMTMREGSPWDLLYSSSRMFGDGLVVMFHAVNFFIDCLARALRADENSRRPNPPAVCSGVLVEENGVGGKVNIFDPRAVDGVFHLVQQTGVTSGSPTTGVRSSPVRPPPTSRPRPS